jgi:hypothetical protein
VELERQDSELLERVVSKEIVDNVVLDIELPTTAQ